MRIDITSTPIPDAPEGVIIHGKIPKMPTQSCFNCNKKDECNILRYSLMSIDSFGTNHLLANLYADYENLPIPMPCRGTAWEAMPSKMIENDPLVQRLGLSSVREHIGEKE